MADDDPTAVERLEADLASARAEIEALRRPPTEPRKFYWSSGDKVSAKPGASPREAFDRDRPLSCPSDAFGIDILSIAVQDRSISDAAFRSLMSMAVMFFRPVMFAPPMSLARKLAVQKFLDAALPIARRAATQGNPLGRAQALPKPEPGEHVATPADRAQAADLLRAAIESGTVIQLPGSGQRILREREKPL